MEAAPARGGGSSSGGLPKQFFILITAVKEADNPRKKDLHFTQLFRFGQRFPRQRAVEMSSGTEGGEGINGTETNRDGLAGSPRPLELRGRHPRDGAKQPGTRQLHIEK